MTAFLYPLLVVHFWYVEAPFGILKFYRSLYFYLLNMFSLKLLVLTFFRPVKNEYREGLIGFSIAFGMIVKSFLILISLFIILLVSFFEIIFLFGFLASPAILVYYLFLV
ncbi:MAG: hypothetical protein A2857_02535 [Candidatus Levybacteria bacterium RIFCSPHIGHO2_01_FULL_36_15]|nr:MAG: hypothetical protein A2857_02535 [Candidatus Levybacteria bacterium RIFCSPHIGHO2_01_FULL_36_15]OGH38636.1 MAG: hypothetical protein A2905_05425 [Candidatus Levybacteria bacterium RIFCSPLOWO2_01_FULL_36_10]